MNNNLICETKTYNLSTRSNSGTILNSDPNMKSFIEYNIPDMIVHDDSCQYIQFSIPYAIIPVSYYTVNQYNNSLCILENNVTTTYSFPNGNYNVSTFSQEFTKLLGTQWSVILNQFNSVLTITNTLNAFTIFKSNSTISSILGFNLDISSAVVSSINTLVMPRCCNFLSLSRICIRCPQLLSGNNMVGSSNASDLIISIPNNAKPNGQIYYQNQTQIKSLYRGSNLSRFTVALTDDDGNLIDFNGIPSFFVLQFDVWRTYVPKMPSFRNILETVNLAQAKLFEEAQQQMEEKE